MKDTNQATIEGVEDTFRFKNLPTISRNDPILRAMSRIALPSLELVTKGLRKSNGAGNGNEGLFTRIWAMTLAADGHGQMDTGTRFPAPDLKEGKRYAPVIPLWFKSKGKKGGAMKITQTGFGMKSLYSCSRKTPLAEHPFFDIHEMVFTNDGSRGTGYRIIQSGKEYLAIYTRLVNQLKYPELRLWFSDQIALIRADPVKFLMDSVYPNHHRIVAKLFYSYNRKIKGDNLGRLTVTFGSKMVKEIADSLYIDDANNGRNISVELDKNQMLVLKAHPKGFKLTAQGAVQSSTLAQSNISEPDLEKFDEVQVGINASFVYDAETKTLTAFIPEDFFKFTKRVGGGCKTRSSKGSQRGRARSLVDDPLTKTKTDLKDAKPLPGPVDDMFALAA
jgi:hypothetical protein